MLIPINWLKDYVDVTLSPAELVEKLFAVDIPQFMPRPDAEQDPSHKQLIPYVLIKCGEKYLTYVRGKRAGETRLVGNRSIGIGGHINPVDNEVPLFGVDYKEIYENAVLREVDEEINITGSRSDRIVALLNDDTNEVGAVHLGVVHVLTVDNENVTRNEQMITQLSSASRITSISYSFQPKTDSSSRTSWIGDCSSPVETNWSNSPRL